MNFAIVGCGNIAKKHIHVIQEYLPDCSVAAFCDIKLDKAQQLGKINGIPAFDNVHTMMEDCGERIDIINILTPSGIHAENVLALAKYGKPLVVEKPIALKLEDADAIIRACDFHRVKLFVVHQNRFNVPIVQARKALEQGRFGKLVMGTVRVRWKRDQQYYDSAPWRGTWAYDGGVFTNQASHHIDMLTWFFGTIESVKAVATTRLVNIECEDTGAAILKFTSGALGIIEATTATRPNDLEGSISILGEKGSVVIGGYFMNELQTWDFVDTMPEQVDITEKFRVNPPGWGYNLGEYLKSVIDAIKNNRAGLVDGLEGRKSLELISAIYESIETGQEITINFKPNKCRLGIT